MILAVGGQRRALLKKKKDHEDQRPNPVEAAHAAAAKLHAQHEHQHRAHEDEVNEMDLLYNRPPSPPPPPPGHFQIDPETRRKQSEFQTYFSVTAIGAKSKDFAYAAADTMAGLHK